MTGGRCESLAAAAVEPPPAAGSVAGDDRLQHRQQRPVIDGVGFVYLDSPRGRIAGALVDDAVRIGNRRVVDEEIDVVLGRQQGTDVAV